jgi:hypothetical protein
MQPVLFLSSITFLRISGLGAIKIDDLQDFETFFT